MVPCLVRADVVGMCAYQTLCVDEGLHLMCKAKADGGQRCYSHTKARVVAARVALNPKDVGTVDALSAALVEHASTVRGAAEVVEWQRGSVDAQERMDYSRALQQGLLLRRLAERALVWAQPLWLDPPGLNYVDLKSSVEYDYDSYGPSDRYEGCRCSPNDYVCRCQVYEGLRVESVDAVRVAASLLGVESDDPRAQGHIARAIKDLGLDENGTYEVSAFDDYYGQTVTVEFAEPGEVHVWVAALGESEPGVVRDPDGVRPYLRDKGHAVTGDLLADVKAALAAENEGRTDPRVEAATGVRVATISRANVVPSNPQHFGRVEARPARAVSEKAPVFHGVVVPVSNTTYALVDGYHRFKGLTRGSGTFIVLDTDD